MSFADLGLSSAILDAIAKQGYETPSPIQSQAIPAVLAGKDVMAAAQTGTGKTAGFTLPILQILSQGEQVRSNQVRALVLTPTRELAAQVAANVDAYAENLPLTSTVVFGGVKINPQMMRLRKGVDVLVATPGRLLDLYSQNAVKFDQLEVLVLDEADRMLDMGFIHDIKRILKVLPPQRQNLLFSATFSDEIRDLAKSLVNDPVEISVTPPNSTAKRVDQLIHPVDKKRKSALLAKLVKEHDWQQVLVFCRTKHGANRLTRFLDEKQGISAAAIHGNKSQNARTKALAAFKSGEVRVLVATDIAARGIDIQQLPQVVNFDLPNVAEDYVHRIGRTGRAGASGKAVSLVCAEESKELRQVESLIGKHLDREILAGFEPTQEVSVSHLRDTPKKPKKPKRTKQSRNEQNRLQGGKGSDGQKLTQPSSDERNQRKPNQKRQRNRHNGQKSVGASQKNHGQRSASHEHNSYDSKSHGQRKQGSKQARTRQQRKRTEARYENQHAQLQAHGNRKLPQEESSPKQDVNGNVIDAPQNQSPHNKSKKRRYRRRKQAS